MSIPAPTRSKGDFQRIPANQIHDAIVDQVIFLGVQRTEWSGKEKFQEKVYVRWQFPLQRITYERDGVEAEGPMVLGRTYTYSFFENAHLGAMLASWRGRPLTDDEQEKFDLFSILGKECKVLVTERQGNDGKIYSNIDKVMPASQGLYKPEGPLVKFHPDYPKDSNVKLEDLRPWVQNKIASRVHGVLMEERGAALHGKGADDYAQYPPVEAYSEEPEDDLPF